MWSLELGSKKVLPPIVDAPKPRKPKKTRRKDPDEIAEDNKKERVRRVGMVMTCTKCKKAAHNSRTCGKEPRTKKAKKTANNMVEGVQSEVAKGVQNSGCDGGEGVQSEADENTFNNGEDDYVVIYKSIIEGKGPSVEVSESYCEVNVAVDDEWTEVMREATMGLPTELKKFRKSLNDVDEFWRNLVNVDNIQNQCASSLPKPSPLRRSQRIMNSPKKGSVRKEFFDLILDEESLVWCKLKRVLSWFQTRRKLGLKRRKMGQGRSKTCLKTREKSWC